VLVLRAAELWGIPPWRVEDEATCIWWERWRVWEDEKAKARKEAAQNVAQGMTTAKERAVGD